MRIEFSQSGGFAYAPGLQRPVRIDAERLQPQEREQLQRLVESARFFELPSSLGMAARGAADCQYDVLTIEDGERRHTVRILAPAGDASVRALLEAVEGHVKTARRAQRAAGGREPG